MKNLYPENFLDKRRINDTQKLSKTTAVVVAKAFYCVGKLFAAFSERKLSSHLLCGQTFC